MKPIAPFAARLALASAIILPILLVAPLAAENTATDPHWLPWLGCWQPVGPEADVVPVGTAPASVCVVPTASASTVEVLTVLDGAVTARDRIDASGVEHPNSEEGCVGTERVEWSADGHRLYRTTDQRCTGGIQRRVSGILAILPSGEWLNAQGVAVGGNTQMRVLRYRPIADVAGFPAEVGRAIQGQRLAREAARGEAAATPSTSDIVEASGRIDPDVVGAWLIERGQGFAVDAKKLLELADAGLPEPVIDIMVALSYPDRFAINQETGEGEMRPEDTDRGDTRRSRRVSRPWGYGGYGYGYPYSYSRYGYGSAWGWGGYYGGYYDGYYGRPVVIVRGADDGVPRPRARAVNGKGYTRSDDGGSSGSTSRPSASRSSGSSASSSSSAAKSSGSSGSSSSSSTATSSGSSGSSGTSTGRTAKPRGGS